MKLCGGSMGRSRRHALKLRARLLATTLLASVVPIFGHSVAMAQAAPTDSAQPDSSQPAPAQSGAAPSNSDLLSMISGLQAKLDGLQTENRSLKMEVDQ